MPFIQRLETRELLEASKQFPALIVTGPRRAGKTTLLRKAFPRFSYILVEDPDVVDRVRSDPRGFLEENPPPLILDEIQNVPEIMNYVRSRIDASPGRMGQWIFTGSQEAALMKGVTESMAGRAAVFQLLPLSILESKKVTPLRGGFPEVVTRPSRAATWFRSYLQTYLERDIRSVSGIRDLATFRRFIALVASRYGQVLNRTDLAGPLGVSVPTISQWLGLLELTLQIVLVPPYYENFGKRLTKAPKIYPLDTGLACHILGIETAAGLSRSPFAGALFEAFVASEILKLQLSQGRSREIYHFRDQQGLEVDFIVPTGPRRLMLVEVRSSRTATPSMAQPMARLAASIGDYEIERFLVYQPVEGSNRAATIAPGVRAGSVEDLLKRLAESRRR